MKKRDIAQCDDTELTTQRPIDYRPAVHALAVGPARREMTLDRSVNHSEDQGSFHEVVGFRHLHNLSFCGLYGFLLLKCFRMAFSYV